MLQTRPHSKYFPASYSTAVRTKTSNNRKCQSSSLSAGSRSSSQFLGRRQQQQKSGQQLHRGCRKSGGLCFFRAEIHSCQCFFFKHQRRWTLLIGQQPQNRLSFLQPAADRGSPQTSFRFHAKRGTFLILSLLYSSWFKNAVCHEHQPVFQRASSHLL